MAEEQQLRLDLEELRQLETVSKRPRVLSLISSEIRSIDDKLSKITAAAAAQPADTSAALAALKYVTLGSFSWDQDNDKIKIYVFLEGVNEEKVESNFYEMSVDVKFHDVQGKNYRISIPKLNKEIVPEKCKVLVKPTKIIITLLKASKGNWLDLHFKEDKRCYFDLCLAAYERAYARREVLVGLYRAGRYPPYAHQLRIPHCIPTVPAISTICSSTANSSLQPDGSWHLGDLACHNLLPLTKCLAG